MSNEETKLNIYQKLLEVRKEVEYVQKSAKGFKFVYADETAILSCIRPVMDRIGLLLEVEMEEPKTLSSPIVSKISKVEEKKYVKDEKPSGALKTTHEEGKIIKEGVTQVPFVFTWINVDNPEERIEKRIYLQGAMGDPQGIGGLMTYANRYFLYKYFNVPTDKLDIDDYEVAYGKKNSAKKNEPTISKEKAREIEFAFQGNEELLKKMLGLCKVERVEDILERQLDSCNKFAEKYL